MLEGDKNPFEIVDGRVLGRSHRGHRVVTKRFESDLMSLMESYSGMQSA